MTVWIYHEVIIDGAKWEYGTLAFYASELILWASIASFVFAVLPKVRKKGVFSWTTDRKAIMAMILCIVPFFLSMIWAADVMLAWQHALRILLLCLLVLLLLLDSRERILWLIFLGGVIPALIGIAQFVTQEVLSFVLLGIAAQSPDILGTAVIVTDGERWLRAYGTLSHPNAFGGLMVVHLIAGWILLQGKKKHHRLIQVIMFIEGMALFMSFSRSAWLAALLFVGFAAFYKKNSIKPLLPVAAGLLVVALVFSHLIIGRASMQTVSEQRSVSERVSGVTESLQVIQMAPLVGAGAGNYTLALMDVYPDLPVWAYQPIHVVPLLVLSEIGVLGALIFLLGLSYLLLLCRQYLPSIVLILISVSPILMLDHYLYSSYRGLMMLGVLIFYIPAMHSLSTRDKQG